MPVIENPDRDLKGEYSRALTVVVDNVGDDNKYVYCKCYCGNYRYILREEFISGKHKTCGCKYNVSKLCEYFVGKQIHRWHILLYDADEKVFHVRCICGETAILRSEAILYNRTKSCGCLRRENVSKATRINLVGQRFGKLTVIESLPIRDKWGAAYFKCKCDCGNYHVARGRHLMVGFVSSCGCLVSIGNMLIGNALTELSITYIPEYRVDLPNGLWGKFDFYVPQYNLMIEFDGRQHFSPEKMYTDKDDASAQARFEKQQYRDRLKDQYCINNNYSILRIPYWERENTKRIIIEHLQRLSEKGANDQRMQQSELTL